MYKITDEDKKYEFRDALFKLMNAADVATDDVLLGRLRNEYYQDLIKAMDKVNVFLRELVEE